MFGVTPCIIGDVTHIELMAVSGTEGQQRHLGRQGKNYCAGRRMAKRTRDPRVLSNDTAINCKIGRFVVEASYIEPLCLQHKETKGLCLLILN